jgi:hypothetical protein
MIVIDSRLQDPKYQRLHEEFKDHEFKHWKKWQEGNWFPVKLFKDLKLDWVDHFKFIRDRELYTLTQQFHKEHSQIVSLNYRFYVTIYRIAYALISDLSHSLGAIYRKIRK